MARARTPGPANPNHVVTMSGAIVPWIHANRGSILAHGALQSAAPPKRK
jgi:hypothetical protein